MSHAESGSHKFYAVTVVGNVVNVRFGRIGTAGQTKSETYASSDEALKAAEGKVKEKLAKGYATATEGERTKQAVARRTKPSLEEQLETLAECGIELSPDVGVDALFVSWEPREFVEEPYLLLLTTLGDEAEDERYDAIYLSPNIWHLDTECIEDNGDYVRIAQRMSILAGGDLPLEDITDHVNLERGEAWLAFYLHGELHKYDLEVSDDWIDGRILDVFDVLLRNGSTSKRYTYLDLEGQDCLIGCCTPEQLDKLKSATGLNFEWLAG